MHRFSDLVLITILSFLAVSCAADDEASSDRSDEIVEIAETGSGYTGLAQAPQQIKVVLPEANARRGSILFTVKGCVICHQVNGVGGKAAPDLTSYRDAESVNPLLFSARMWRGASAMTQLQSIELGYTIELDDQDIADLAAFASSSSEQELFTIDSVGKEMQSWFLDERYWVTGDWDEYANRESRIPKMDSDTE
jgi:cytochrome c